MTAANSAPAEARRKAWESWAYPAPLGSVAPHTLAHKRVRLDRLAVARHPRKVKNQREGVMILEVRTYTAYPGKAAQWLDYYEKHGLPVQQKYLGGLIGFF